jgi:hypothetical protein
MMTQASRSDCDRIPLPGNKPWPTIAAQREYWVKREKLERDTLILLEQKLNQLDAVILTMMDDVEKLRRIIDTDIPDT